MPAVNAFVVNQNIEYSQLPPWLLVVLFAVYAVTFLFFAGWLIKDLVGWIVNKLY